MTGTGTAVQAIDKPSESERASGTVTPAVAELLESWKDIAGYLRRDTRTVQRWEKSLGLPVHRVQNPKSGSVFAYTSEIDHWRRERMLQVARDKLPAVVEPSQSHIVPTPKALWRHEFLPLAALLFGILLGVGITLFAQSVVHSLLSPAVLHAGV